MCLPNCIASVEVDAHCHSPQGVYGSIQQWAYSVCLAQLAYREALGCDVLKYNHANLSLFSHLVSQTNLQYMTADQRHCSVTSERTV